MEQNTINSLQENEVPLSPGNKPPWDPKGLTWLSFVFSFGAAGIIAGLNWRRLGKPQYTYPTIVFSAIGLIGFIIILMKSSYSENMLRITGYGINLGIGFFLSRWQSEAYKQWVSVNGTPAKKQSGILIPVIICLSTLAIILLFMFGIPLLQNDVYSPVEVVDSQYNSETSDQSGEGLSKEDTDGAQYFLTARVHSDKYEFRAAIVYINKAININQDVAAYYFLRGSCYSMLREFDKALEDLSQAIILDNYYYEAYHNRSMVYNSLEEYDKALADINRAIDLNATDDPLYHARGMIHENMKNIDQALIDYDSGLTINPDNDGIYFSRGLLFYENKMIEKARADLKKAVELNSENLLIINEMRKRFPEFNLEL